MILSRRSLAAATAAVALVGGVVMIQDARDQPALDTPTAAERAALQHRPGQVPHPNPASGAAADPVRRIADIPGSNLTSNSAFNGPAGWALAANTTYDPAVTAPSSAGGSIRLGTLDATGEPRVTSAAFTVVPGTQYTLSARMRHGTTAANWPPGMLTLLVVNAANGDSFVDQIYAGVGTGGEFQEVVMPWRATVPNIKVAFVRYDTLMFDKTTPIWIDDFTVRTGNRPAYPNTTAKTGASSFLRNRIDAKGNWSRLVGGTWTEWFPMCAAIDAQRSDFSTFKAAGFNCDIWSGGYDDLMAKDAAAGLCSFMQTAQWYIPGGWAYRNWGDLTARITATYNGPYGNNFCGYWFDNEPNPAWGTWSDYLTMWQTLDTADRQGGVRRSPMIQLQNGSYNRSFATAAGQDFAEVTGAYMDVLGLHDLHRQTGNFRVPQTGCQINVPGSALRSLLYACIAHGGRGLSMWGDNMVGAPPMPGQEWWPAMPQLSAEMNTLLPVIQADDSTRVITSTQTQDVTPISWGAKNVAGTQVVIASNMTTAPQSLTLTADFTVTEVRDYFTGVVVATPNSATFTLPALAGRSNTTGTGVYRLLGTATPTTTTVPTTTTTTLPPAGTIDDGNPAHFTFGSSAVNEADGWVAYAPPGRSDERDCFGTNHATSKLGSTAQIRFNGTSLALIGAVAPSYGAFSVVIDNQPPLTVDAYAATAARAQTLLTRTLPPGDHLATITLDRPRNLSSSGDSVVLDCAAVTGQGTPPPSTIPTTTRPASTVPTTTRQASTTIRPTTTVVYFPVRCVATPTGITCKS